jgi:hypothetical protein
MGAAYPRNPLPVIPAKAAIQLSGAALVNAVLTIPI